MYTEEFNKVALRSNDDKRIQTFDRVTTYPYGTNVFKVCENEMLLRKNKVMHDQEKYRLGTDDYLSALTDRSKDLDKYKELNTLYDHLVNHVWRMIYGKNRVNNEIDNIDCNIVEDAKTYLNKYIKVVSDKKVLIHSVSESIDELIEGLDVTTSNDIAIKEIKDFKRGVIKSIDKFNSYIKLETKKKDIEKKDIEKKGIKKKDTAKEHIANVNAKKIASNMMLIINQLLMLILRHI